MDRLRENPSNGSSSSSANPSQNVPSHANFKPSAVAPGQYAPTTNTPGVPSQGGQVNTRPIVTTTGSAQIARSGGIGLATTIGAANAAALQRQLRQSPQQGPIRAPANAPAPQRPYMSTAQRNTVNNGTAMHQSQAVRAQSQAVRAQVPGKQDQSWGVPNPLGGGGQPRAIAAAQRFQQPPRQPMPQVAPVPARVSKPMPQAMAQKPLLQQMSAPRSQYPASNPMPTQQKQKPRVTLSPEAKSALAKAIWSAIRSPTGMIDPKLMNTAMATGLPKNAILNAARVAREREAMKRKQDMGQNAQQQLKHQVPHKGQASSIPSYNPAFKAPGSRAPQPQAGRVALPQYGKVAVPQRQVPVAPPRPKPAPGPTAQQIQATRMMQLRAEERAKWRRVHHGIFTIQKGKYGAPPHTVCSIIRTNQVLPVLKPSNISNTMRKRPRTEVLNEAMLIQQKFRRTVLKSVPLHDPDRFRRVKIEPKKFAKALDRVVRKARQTASETLNKQHKELSKAIVSHQQDFIKFHRQRKTDANRIAKLIRDNFDKEGKKKEKDAVAAERARLAALKANDMDAYSKLLEETKNDRLKFLMDKTERHFSQISTSLLQARNKDGSVSSSGGTASYYASAHLKTEEVRQPSLLVGGDLKEYQMSGLQWLVSLYNNKLNGILADEMGLGKTIQAISLVAYLMEFKNNLGPYLVIVPLSTLSNWVNEFHKWLPSAHVICYKGTPGQRKELYKDQVSNGHFNILLTTYEYIIKDKASLRKITWQYAIVDEGHRMKNAASKFAKTLSSQYTTKFRLLLTGTPLMNDLSELWSLLNFLLPSIFNSVDTFDQWFNRPFASFGNAPEDEANVLSNEERMFIIHRLHELLRPFMLRRVKSEVLDQLPEKVEKILRCELSSWQKELYKQISKKAVAENTTGFVEQDQQTSRGLNNVVMQLRKVCNHPYLFSPEGYHINENIIRSSAKFELLDRMLPKLKAAGHRVLMFTQMTQVMTILEDYFAYRGYMSLRLDGSTPAEEREKRMYKFNAPDSPYFIFLLSTRAGGLGLNLTAANTVIIFDSDWNPMMDLQAQDRAHRIGQRSDVSVFRLVTYSPVEEKILSRATEKLNMSELVVEAGQFDKRSVENDNSLERKKMMEVLLTDFTTNTAKLTEDKATSELTSDLADEDDDDDESEESKDELNDLLSNNENDYQLYHSMDKKKATEPVVVDTSLFTSENDVPDWIKYPVKKKSKAALDRMAVADSGPRKRKEVSYDDGLTEKQFLRLMDKQFDKEAAAREEAKLARRTALNSGGAGGSAGPSVDSELTDWTFRKLISCSKAVVNLKDPATKRKLSDIFLEKPSPEQFPDYYEIIEKPIGINDILRKCRGKLYSNLQEFRDDWKLMVANAKQFNGEDSWVVEDGKALVKELDRVLKKNGISNEDVAAKPKTPPKPTKKKLRIKLSLKTLKTKGESGDAQGPDESQTKEANITPKGKKGKKRKIAIETN